MDRYVRFFYFLLPNKYIRKDIITLIKCFEPKFNDNNNDYPELISLIEVYSNYPTNNNVIDIAQKLFH